MTKCIRGEVNLKSTAYNLDGQNYFEQLRAYNSMSSHLRRVLSAKCVVDAKNKNYMRKKKQLCKQIDCKPRSSRTRLRNDIIDRLAYDTLHHPADFLRMSCDTRYFYKYEDEKYFVTDCYDYDGVCSRSMMHDHVNCPTSSTVRTNKSHFVSNDRQTKEQSFTQPGYKKTLKPEDAKAALKIHDISEQRYEEDSFDSDSDILTREVNHTSTGESSSRSYENSESAGKTHAKDEEAKYAKFVYEITHEIMHNGLYTDKELQEVFDRHVKKNREYLNMNKMLYEIYRLKLSLNISDDSDDEELEDLVHNQQLLSISRVRPPTPPKVLDDNKIIEKITSYQQPKETRRRSSASNKSVVLVDANPELHVTERDILISLVESNINPEQAQQIYKRLSFKSKDIPKDTAKAKTERPNVENDNDRIDHDFMELNNMNEQEKSSTTQDLITQEDKDVQA